MDKIQISECSSCERKGWFRRKFLLPPLALEIAQTRKIKASPSTMLIDEEIVRACPFSTGLDCLLTVPNCANRQKLPASYDFITCLEAGTNQPVTILIIYFYNLSPSIEKPRPNGCRVSVLTFPSFTVNKLRCLFWTSM